MEIVSLQWLPSVLRIRDVYPGSKFFHHGSWIHGQIDYGSWIPDPDPHQRISIFLTQKIVSNISEILSWMFTPP
jgi:hypothetical protein